jgi:signal peptidase
VIGKTVFCIPLLGYFAQYIQTKAGNIVVICFGVAFILFVVVVDILTENRGDKNKKGKGDVRDEES